MFKTIAIGAAISFASIANAQVAQKNVSMQNIIKAVVVQPKAKSQVKINSVSRTVLVADARYNNNARMIGRNYVGNETGIEGINFNRK